MSHLISPLKSFGEQWNTAVNINLIILHVILETLATTVILEAVLKLNTNISMLTRSQRLNDDVMFSRYNI